MFKNEPELNACGSSLRGYFRATYKELVKALGEPCEADGYKVSTEWKVRDGENIYTIYDWKETSLYDPELWSVEEFRENEEPYLWHIGGYTDPEYFLTLLHDQIAKS